MVWRRLDVHGAFHVVDLLHPILRGGSCSKTSSALSLLAQCAWASIQSTPCILPILLVCRQLRFGYVLRLSKRGPKRSLGRSAPSGTIACAPVAAFSRHPWQFDRESCPSNLATTLVLPGANIYNLFD